MNYSADSLFSCLNLACAKGERELFAALEFELHPGEILQVEGANGSGKTSLLKILCGIAAPDEGEVLWNKENIRKSGTFLASLTYLAHLPGIKNNLTPLENIEFAQCLKSSAFKDLDNILTELGLRGFEDVAVASLSAGQKRRVVLARLFIANSQLWILDEPFTSLDKHAVATLVKKIKQHQDNNGMTVITAHRPLKSLFDKLHTINTEDYKPCSV